MEVKLFQDRLEAPNNPLGFRRVLPSLDHLLDKTTLMGQARLTLGDVRSAKASCSRSNCGLGMKEHARSRAKAPQISHNAQNGMRFEVFRKSSPGLMERPAPSNTTGSTAVPIRRPNTRNCLA